MSSSESELDDDSSSSGYDSPLLAKTLFDEQSEEDENSLKKSRDLIHTTIINASVIVSTLLGGKKRAHGGTTSSRRYIHRERRARHEVIIKDYFNGEKSKYTSDHFRRRFRMDVELFNRILEGVEKNDSYFSVKFDATRKEGLSPLQKTIAAVRMLAYGCPADLLDEYVQIGESTAIESLKHFCDAVISVFEQEYLRKPNKKDISGLLQEAEERGFPGMLGSLDCMHWHWKNCPTAWHGTHTNGFKRVPTLILEIVASKNLWIWHAFFGMAGTNNDITVLDRSSLFDDIINGVTPPCRYVVQGHHYDMGYYLTDGIYPQYATLMQSISQPSSLKVKLFSERQEATRKDVERAFGVLQSRWHIVKGPARMWKEKDLEKIMKTCIILHNMIIESESSQGMNPENWQPLGDERVENVELERDYNFIVSRMIGRMKQVQDKRVHRDFKNDLINHIWELYGNQQAS